jgi:hypothetical protein
MDHSGFRDLKECVKISNNWRNKLDPYSTHLPVLKMLGQLDGIETIVEFGSGPYSTKEFLNTEIYKDLKILYSFESSIEWIKTVASKISDDRFIPIYNVTEQKSLSLFKLIKKIDITFVDGASSEMRIPTVKSAILQKSKIVVVHDTENPDYIEVFDLFRYHHTYSSLNPHTTIFTNSTDVWDLIQKILSEEKVNDN